MILIDLYIFFINLSTYNFKIQIINRMRQYKEQTKQMARKPKKSNLFEKTIIQNIKQNQKTQDAQDFELKISKLKKQVNLLNMDVNYLIQERKFKGNIIGILHKQIKGLENNFLFKNGKRQSELIERTSENAIQQNNNRNILKNRFRDVNQQILHFTKKIQTQAKSSQEAGQNSLQKSQANQNKKQNIPCQTLHLKQIFNPQSQKNYQQKGSKLRQKLSLLYQKIRLNLQREEPYIHDKIMSRIKRQAQQQTKLRLLSEIQSLTKENSVWMTQQTNRVDNNMQEKQIQQICVINLGLMKKIMNKKIFNNDFIFENYERAQKVSPLCSKTFPTDKVFADYSKILKRIQQSRITSQLDMVKDEKNDKTMLSQRQSLKCFLSDPSVSDIWANKKLQMGQFRQAQNDLVSKCESISAKIQHILKKK